MYEILQIIHQDYKQHKYHLSSKALIFCGLGFGLLNFLGVLFLGIPAIPIPVTNPITFLFDLVYNMIMFILVQNLALFATVFYERRNIISQFVQSSIRHSKKRMDGYYHAPEDIEELQEQVVSISIFTLAIEKITSTKQIAGIFYYIIKKLRILAEHEYRIKRVEQNLKEKNQEIRQLKEIIDDTSFKADYKQKKLDQFQTKLDEFLL